MARKTTTTRAAAPKSSGELSVREAGRLGGNKVKEKYGPDFYSEIGTKGGETVRREVEKGTLPKDFYSQIGQKGGNTVKEEYGPEFYSQIGKKGGNKVKEEYGPEFYSQIGTKGGNKVRDLINAGKAQMEGRTKR